MPCGTVGVAAGNRQRAITTVHFVSWTVLGCDFVPPVLNICIQFIRRVYSCWRGNGAQLCVFNDSVLLISVAYFLEQVFLATCHLSSCNLLQKELVLQNNFSRKLQLSAPFISVPALKDTSARWTKTDTDTQPEPGSCRDLRPFALPHLCFPNSSVGPPAPPASITTALYNNNEPWTPTFKTVSQNKLAFTVISHISI